MFINGGPRRIRTFDRQIRNLMLYPAELWDLRERLAALSLDKLKAEWTF